MTRVFLTSTVLAVAHLIFSAATYADVPKDEVKLLFSNSQDVANTWGKLHFGATPLQKIRDCENPGFAVVCCLPTKDGSWGVYGQVFEAGDPPKTPWWNEVNSWKLVHATTRDGVRFENVETVFQAEPGSWTPHIAIAYNPEAKKFLMLKLKMDKGGFGYRAFTSSDGKSWEELSKEALYYDGDSMGLFWSPTANRFVSTCKTTQPFLKHIIDHGGAHPQNKNDNLRDRRVLAFRSSTDGQKWDPADSTLDIWNQNNNYKSMPADKITTPDANDPPDMEFYRGIGFWYHDRSYMMVLNYAGSLLMPRKHGPQLDTEWWVSRDGLKWDRPYRGTNAFGDTFPFGFCVSHNPMIIDGMILFHFGSHLLGMKQDRISYVGARANAEFSTVPFQMPQADLCLNAAVPSPDRVFAKDQAYVMASVLDEQGKVIPGFEADKCVIQNADKIDLPLRWKDKSAKELAGRKISLRFYLRSANIYAVTSKK